MALSTLGAALEFKAKWPDTERLQHSYAPLKEALASVERQAGPRAPDSSSERLWLRLAQADRLQRGRQQNPSRAPADSWGQEGPEGFW